MHIPSDANCYVSYYCYYFYFNLLLFIFYDFCVSFYVSLSAEKGAFKSNVLLLILLLHLGHLAD